MAAQRDGNGGNGNVVSGDDAGAPEPSSQTGSAPASLHLGSANHATTLVGDNATLATQALPGNATLEPQPPPGALIPTHRSKGYVVELGYDPGIAGAGPQAPYGYTADGERPRKRPPFGQPFALGVDSRRQPGGTKVDDTPKMRDKARRQGDAAMRTLVQVMTRGANDRVRLDAAIALLDRGYGKPTQMIAGEGDNPIRIEVREQLVTKLKALAATAGVVVPLLPGAGKN